MGTNYYACRTRATIEEPIHIGKCSYGWLFLFRDQDEPPAVWHDYGQVFDWLYENVEKTHDYAIVNEYDEIVSFHDFINKGDEHD